MAAGAVFTKKIGGVPGWGWAIGGVIVGGGLLYYEKKKKAAAAAQAAAAPSSAPGAATGAGVATMPYGPAGGAGIDSNTLAAILASQGAGSVASSGTAATPAPYVPPTGETYGGAGYGTPSGTGTITSYSGQQFAELLPGSNAVPGQTYYYQPAPGIFTPIPAGQNVEGAPYFVPVGASA